jgi:tetratricopeptide (TPR) repeat protein
VDDRHSTGRHELAQRCVEKQWYAGAARIYHDVLTARPDLTGLLFPAACAAARAGTGQGRMNLRPTTGRARWRQQALDWLRADLDLRRKSPQASKLHARIWLEIWKSQPDLAGVRDANAIAELPQAERQAWEGLWAEVESLLRQLDDVKVYRGLGNVLSPVSRPDGADGHCFRGNALLELGKLDEALAAYKEALRLKPDFADAHCGVGHVLEAR